MPWCENIATRRCRMQSIYRRLLVLGIGLVSLCGLVMGAAAQPGALNAPAGSLQTKTLWLPFHREPQTVTYEVIHGLAFLEGDIILDDAETHGGAGSVA